MNEGFKEWAERVELNYTSAREFRERYLIQAIQSLTGG